MYTFLNTFYIFIFKRSITLDKALSKIEGSLKLRNLSKTRWTARAESLRAVWLSFEEIVSVLHEISTKSTIDKKTKVQALGLENKCLSIDFIIYMYFMNHIMYQMKILTETLETKDLNIVDTLILIDSSIKSLTETRNNSTLINELIASAKSFCLKLDIDFDGDFKQHHRKRLKPKKIDSNQQSHVNLTYEDFYRKEFLQVLDTLISLSSENLKSCLVCIQPLFKVLSVLISSNITVEDVEKAFSLFPKNCDMSSVTDFNSALCEINILRLQTENNKSLANVMDVANKLRTIIPMANE